MKIAHIVAAVLALVLSACAEGPGDQRSLRGSLADWIDPSGGHDVHGAGMGAAQPAPALQGAYEADIARQQAGVQSVNVSEVTILGGGQVNVHVGGVFSGNTDWRPADGGVTTATVAECESVAMSIPRADKHGGATVYFTRINGIVYASQYSISGCQTPMNAQSFPGYGHFPLNIRGVVEGAAIHIAPWGAVPYR